MLSKLNGYWKQKITYYKILAHNLCVCVCVYTSKYLHYSYVKHDIYTINESWEAFLVKYHSFFTTRKEEFRNFMMALKWQAPKIQIHTSGLIKISLKLKRWKEKNSGWCNLKRAKLSLVDLPVSLWSRGIIFFM